MWIAYIDESKDENKFFIYSALVVRAERWPAAFASIKAFRAKLRATHGIYIKKELHASKFAAGKGAISDRPLSKVQRAAIFRECLEYAATCGKFSLISSANTVELYAFERLMNRLNRTAKAKDEQIILVCDEGEEARLTKRIRKMRAVNFIPSRYGSWPSTKDANIPLDRFIEDPFFKDSATSYFIQLVDFCAYALMRMERPIESKSLLGYNTAYEILKPIAFKKANMQDWRGLGIIR